jgi:hypothetical protein
MMNARRACALDNPVRVAFIARTLPMTHVITIKHVTASTRGLDQPILCRSWRTSGNVEAQN